MSRYLLDTDWIIDALNGQDAAIQTLLELVSSGLTLSIITYGELYEGAYYSRNPEPALAGLHAFLEGKDVLPLSQAVIERFAIVRGALSARFDSK